MSNMFRILIEDTFPEATQKERVVKMQKKINILIIDNKEDDVSFLKEVLNNHKRACHLTVMESGIKAIEYFVSLSEDDSLHKPQLVILDLDLNGMQGWQVLERLKNDRSLKVIPVVLLTSSVEKDSVFKAYNMFANSYIVKKGNKESMKHVFELITDFWLNTVSLPDAHDY